MATWEDIICTAKDLADSAGRKVADVPERLRLFFGFAQFHMFDRWFMW